MTDLRLVIFDVDGTLIDSQDHIVAAMSHAFAAIDRPAPPRARILSIVGLSLPDAMAALTPHDSAEIHERLTRAYRDSFVARRAESAPPPFFPGALDALNRLRARPETLLGIATGKARRGLDHLFSATPIGPWFTTVQSADDHPSKPHPAMIEAALSETGADPARAVMVGDTDFDIEMGRNAGIATIAVTWGYHERARLEAARPDRIIASYDDLDTALAALIGAPA